jgi:hypothetical protein
MIFLMVVSGVVELSPVSGRMGYLKIAFFMELPRHMFYTVQLVG